MAPSRGVVVGVVADQGVGDLVGAVGHGEGDDVALLAAGSQSGGVGLRGDIVQLPAHAEVDQGAAHLDAALATDAAVAALVCGLVLVRVQARRAVELLGSGPATRIADPGGVVRCARSDPSRARWFKVENELAGSNSVIASRSTASVLIERRPITLRCSVTWPGFNSRTCHTSGHADGASNGRCS